MKKNKEIINEMNEIVKRLLGDKRRAIFYEGSKTAKLIYNNIPDNSPMDLAIDVALNLKSSHNSSSKKDCLKKFIIMYDEDEISFIQLLDKIYNLYCSPS